MESIILTSYQRKCWLVLGALISLLLVPQSVCGQAQLADDLVLISKGQREQERQRDDIHVGPSPGAPGSRLARTPGSGEPALREKLPSDRNRTQQRRDVLSAASSPIRPVRYQTGPEEIAPSTRLSPAEPRAAGPLEVPKTDEDGPANGLTLDSAITILTSDNLDLQTKFQEVPKADADVLTAGLRGNPLVFGSVDNVPYGSYSPQRPGETGYGLTVIQPWDINDKRSYRILAAQRAKDVVQAQYQDAVRIEIDNLYVAFTDVLAAREGVRYVEAALAGIKELKALTEKQVPERASTLELDRIVIQQESAEISREEAEANLLRAKRALATLLNLPFPEEAGLEIRGGIRSQVDKLPSADELVAMAHANRPDLMAYHLGSHRAEAEVDLARKERYPDVFVLYTPYGLQNNQPNGGQNTPSWGLSLMASVPIFNRNQGNIRRAELNVMQTRIEWGNLTRQVESEVRNAAKEQELTLAQIQRIEKTILPKVRNLRDTTYRLLQAGEADTMTYLSAQREYVDVVRQYRDALVRHRRAVLKLNTAVAMRIVP